MTDFYRPVHDEGDVWREESWSFHEGTHVSQFLPIHISHCVFVDGSHYPGFDCPHYNGVDDTEFEPGWTAQQNRKENT